MKKKSRVERWLPCPGYESVYSVSDQGRVRRDSTLRVLSPSVSPVDGYPIFHPSVGGVQVTKRTHPLVAEAFLGERPEGAQINHKDGDKANNWIGNLEYCSPSENVQHAYATGLCNSARGAGHGRPAAKLTEVQVKTAVIALKIGFTRVRVAKHLGVAGSTIDRIALGRTWSWLTGVTRPCTGL